MSDQGAPVCPRHEGEVEMRFQSIRTDSSRPQEAFSLFECPECGAELRRPLVLEPV